jgi:hypothetical protein
VLLAIQFVTPATILYEIFMKTVRPAISDFKMRINYKVGPTFDGVLVNSKLTFDRTLIVPPGSSPSSLIEDELRRCKDDLRDIRAHYELLIKTLSTERETAIAAIHLAHSEEIDNWQLALSEAVRGLKKNGSSPEVAEEVAEKLSPDATSRREKFN